MRGSAWLRAWWWAAVPVAACAVAAVLAALHGRLVLDEGWYVYGARLAAHGAVPYRDFLFTQTPLVLYLFAPTALLGASSVLATRLLCAAMGVVALALTLRAAHRAAGPAAVAWVLALLATSASYWYNVTTARVIAPPALVAAAALHELTADRGDGRRFAWATAILSLGVGLRLSLLVAVGVMALIGLARWRHDRAACLRIAAAAVVPAGALLGAAWLLAGERFWFGVVGFHELYYGPAGSGPLRYFLRAFARSLALDHAVLLAAAVVALLIGVAAAVRGGRAREAMTPAGFAASVAGLLWGALLVVHVSRSAPQVHHQTMFMGLLAFAAAVAFARLPLGRRAARLAPTAAAVLALASLPWQHWPVAGRGGDLATLARAGEAVRREARGRPILTFDPTVALAAGSSVVSGYEMGMFAYWPDYADARAFGGRNAYDLCADLARRPAVVALQDLDLRRLLDTQGKLPLGPVLRSDYRLAAQVPDYGQWLATLRVFVPAGPAGASPVRCPPSPRGPGGRTGVGGPADPSR